MPRLSQNAAAVLVIVLSAAFVAATSLLAKALGVSTADVTGLHPLQISAGRYVFALLALILFILLRPRQMPTFKGAAWRTHIIRCILGSLGVTFIFAAVAKMPVAEATAISYISPLVTMALAIMFLAERATARKFISAFVALVGAALILKPGTDAFQPAGFLALASAVFIGSEAIFIKRLSDTEPPLRILLISNSIGSCLSLLACSFFWLWPTSTQWLLLVAVGVFMLMGQAAFIQGMKRGDASFVIPAFYFVLVFAALYDFAIYGVFPAGLALAGMILIALSAVMLAVKRN